MKKEHGDFLSKLMAEFKSAHVDEEKRIFMTVQFRDRVIEELQNILDDELNMDHVEV